MSMSEIQYYRLEGREMVPVDRETHFKIGYQDSEERRVAYSYIGNYLRVSTVALPFDHASPGDPPELFETMVFSTEGPSGELYRERSPTWDKAEWEHKWAVAWAGRMVSAIVRPTEHEDMPYEYRVRLDVTTDGEPCFVASVAELPGCTGQGATRAKAHADVREAQVLYIKSLEEDGLEVPTPSPWR